MEQKAYALPIIRWRGWRPLPLDMTADEQGGQVFLVFDRQGDLALLPTATVTYICYAPLGNGKRWEDYGVDPVSVSYSAAAARHAVMQAVHELEADGWHVIGRLHATFHGVDTEDDFWARVDCAVDEPGQDGEYEM
jgi:hypothetical protein